MKFAVCVTFRIVPEHFGRFMELMIENASASLANEIDCHQFDVCTDGDRPYEVFLYETYASRDAFDVHLQTKHFKMFNAETKGMIEDKQIKIYDSVN